MLLFTTGSGCDCCGIERDTVGSQGEPERITARLQRTDAVQRQASVAAAPAGAAGAANKADAMGAVTSPVSLAAAAAAGIAAVRSLMQPPAAPRPAALPAATPQGGPTTPPTGTGTAATTTATMVTTPTGVTAAALAGRPPEVVFSGPTTAAATGPAVVVAREPVAVAATVTNAASAPARAGGDKVDDEASVVRDVVEVVRQLSHASGSVDHSLVLANNKALAARVNAVFGSWAKCIRSAISKRRLERVPGKKHIR